MPRSRGSQMPQRKSPWVPLHLKTTVCSEANGINRNSIDRISPKLDDRRSPRSPLHDKKRGVSVADLETKLTQTQEELKKLKEQLASAEAAKRDAQQELEATKKLIPVIPNPKGGGGEEEETTQESVDLSEPVHVHVHVHVPVPAEESINSPATDVFEVAPAVSTRSDESERSKNECEDAMEKSMIEEEEQHPESNVDVSNELNDKMAKIEKEIEALASENEGLRKQVEAAAAASKVKEEEMSLKLVKVEEELEESNTKAKRLEEEMEGALGAKEALEAEMKRLRVQTEQWRKAAEAAAAVLSAGDNGIGRTVSGRCGSMEKNVGGYGFVGSPGLGGGEADEEGSGGGKRRGGGGGMKMFGDLWKKKGQK